MSWRLMTSYADYVSQRWALICDPVYQGVQIPRGHGEPVFLIPGFLAGDWSFSVLAGWLNRLGYTAYYSGIDWNIVEVYRLLGQLLSRHSTGEQTSQHEDWQQATAIPSSRYPLAA